MINGNPFKSRIISRAHETDYERMMHDIKMKKLDRAFNIKLFLCIAIPCIAAFVFAIMEYLEK